MPPAPLSPVLRYLHHVVAPKLEHSSDGELLSAFIARHDEESFAALVRRHGALVLNVCRHVLGHEQDAEDAFQATFLVLARKAGSVREVASLAGFLHGVAYRLSLKAKRDAARRRKYERNAPPTSPAPGVNQLAWREVQALVEEEIARLPERYRTPFIRCYLQGRSRAEAARELGVKEGTIWSRLSWARHRLQERLARRGVALTAVFAAFALSDRTCPASLSRLRAVVSANARAFASGQTLTETASARALSLAKESLPIIAPGKLKLTMTSLLLVLLAGMGGALFSARMAHPKEALSDARPVESPRREPAPQARTDRHGDPLPEGAIARLGTVRWRHGFFVDTLVFSPDGKKIAAVGAGRDITLWDAATGKEIHQFPNKVDQPVGLAFSPDGKMFATSARKGIITLWDVDTGKEVRQLQGSRSGSRLAFAPDGKILAASNYDDTVRMWDLATGKEQRRLKCEQKGLYSLAFSPDGNLLATAGIDGNIRLWDPRTGEAHRRLAGHGKAVSRVVFAPDGKLLASSSEDNTIRFWDTATGQQVWKREENLFGPGPIAFSPDGTLLASGHLDGTIALWDVASREEKRRWQTGSKYVFTFAFSPDGKTLAAASSMESTIHFWDVATGRERRPSDEHQGPIRSLRFSPDGAKLVSIGQDRQLCRWDLATSTAYRQFVWKGEPLDVSALSPDGHTLAVGARSDNEVRLWDVRTGKPGRVLGKHEPKKRIWDIAFSPDGRLVASGGDDRVIHIWDVRDGKEIRQIKGLAHPPRSLRFTPDSKGLACGMMTHGDASAQPTLRLWDVASGKERCSFNSYSAFTGALAFSPDGKMLASGYGSHREPAGLMVRVWDTATGKELCRHSGHREGIGAVAFSPDGKLVASGSGEFCDKDNSVHVWEAATGRLIRHFEGHHSGVYSLAFSPDGLTVASGAGDSTILLWDIAGGLLSEPRTKRSGVSGFPPAALTPRELDACWTALANQDAAKAYDAVWKLIAAPEQAVPFLGKHLTPAPNPDAKIVAERIAELDSDDFAIRQRAADKLSKYGDAIIPALQQTLDGKPALEVRRRIQQLLDQARDWTAERLRDHRAIQVLEHIGTPAAKDVLQRLTTGAPDTLRTEEAKAALRRCSESRPSRSEGNYTP